MTEEYVDNIYYRNLHSEISAAVDVIISWRADLNEPNPSWPKRDFENISYSIWAADEIIGMMISHIDWTPGKTIEEFKYQMNRGMKTYMRFPDIQRIFEIGYSAAENISEILYAMDL